MIKKRFEELKQTGNLPSPSGVGMRILSLAQQENGSLDELVRAIQADPALTGRILKLARSALHHGVAPVTSVREAAMRLGLRAVSNVALGFTLVAGNRSGTCKEFDYDGYWSSSLARAVAAGALAAGLQHGDPAEAFTLGLLSRIGELGLASAHPEGYARILQRQREDESLDLRKLESVEFEIDHVEVATYMFGDWGLPAHFGAAIECLEEAWSPAEGEPSELGELVKTLRMAVAIVDSGLLHDDPGALESVAAQPECRELDSARVRELGQQIAEELKDWSGLLMVPVEVIAKVRALPDPKCPTHGTEGGIPVVHGLRVLAVDDDRVALKLLAKHLEAAGHAVVTAENGREGLQLALACEPQVVVTDWMMPEIDGLQVCKALRSFSAGKKMYILLLTGHGEEDRIVEAFEAGADDYIVKPFKPKLLLARIRAAQRVVLAQEEAERESRERIAQNVELNVTTRKLHEAAMTDSLTEIANRRFAMKRLDTEWSVAERSGTPLAVVMLDVDDFKRVNDGYGHDLGDLVLQRTGRVMAQSVRRGDTVARIGGEEFLILCPRTDAEEALAVAERVRKSMESERFGSEGAQFSVTISGGVAVNGPGIESAEQLLKAADQAVYAAKRTGRNRISLAKGTWGESKAG